MSDDRQPRGITAITVSGFKSLRNETTVQIRPLTLLAGANSSGKSSIMQPLLLMKQTLEAAYDPGVLKLDGPIVRFTEVEQFLHLEHNNLKDLVIQIVVEDTLSLRNIFRFVKDANNREMTLVRMVYSNPDGVQDIFPEMPGEQIQKTIPGPIMESLFEQMEERKEGEEISIIPRVIRNRCFLELEISVEISGLTRGGITGKPGELFGYHISEMIHVPGLRNFPERTYPLTPVVGPRFPGIFSNYFASLIYHWQHTEHNEDKQLTQLAKALTTLGLTSRMSTNRLNDTHIELRVGRTLQSNETDMVSLADMGFGVSQVMPVLVGLLAAQPGQMVYLEQPELHLHPRAQVALASVLADAANRGVRVVAETHSSLLLLGVQTLIAQGILSPDKVMLHWFTRGEDGVTTVDSVDPDENGAYGDWPEDFADVELDSQKRYLDAVAAREMGMVDGEENRVETPGD
jgi:predicted ATPase